MTAANAGLGYRPDVDGLRTIAVFSVLLFHAQLGPLHGGYAGVDVFFVISGFLITSILAAAIDGGRLDLADFYERRARRILPPLFLMAALTLPPAWILLHPVDFKDFAQSLAAVSTFTSNILFYLESDYFAPAADLKPLLHTWSLAVEEQFYMVIPLLLLSVWRFGARAVAGVLGVLAVASLTLAVFALPRDPSAAFYMLPTRAWELLVGALLALARRRWPGAGGSQVLSLAGLAAIAWSVLMFTPFTAFPGLPALVPTLGAALVIAFTAPGTLAYRLLASRPFVFLGLASYSIYLFHQPIFALANIYTFQTLSVAAKIGLAAVTVLLAVLTRFWVERPFRDRSRISTRRFLILMAGCGLFFIGVGVAGHVTGGFAQRQVEKVGKLRAVLPDYEPDNQLLYAKSKVFRSGRKFSFSGAPDRHRILVAGNSHAEDLFGVLSSEPGLFPRIEVSLEFIQIRCFAAGVEEGPARAFFASDNFRRAQTVVVSARWNLKDKRTCDGRGPSVGDLDGLEGLFAATRAAGKRLVITGPSPEFPQSATTTLADDVLLRLAESAGTAGAGALASQVNGIYFVRRNVLADDKSRLRAFAASHGMTFLDKAAYVCDEQARACHALTQRGGKTMWDYSHHTLTGAKVFAERAAAIGWLDPLLGRTPP